MVSAGKQPSSRQDRQPTAGDHPKPTEAGNQRAHLVKLVQSLPGLNMLDSVTAATGCVAQMLQQHYAWLSTPHFGFEPFRILVVNWAVQFVFSWLAFSLYVVWDYRNYKARLLESKKLPSRHPLDPFWWSQLRMVPLVLYNQVVVWPLVSLVLIWPQWALNEKTAGEWGWKAFPALIILMLISDQMWYWSHRFMHTPYAWKHWHKMHHVAEQTAISATYVHPVEYAMFTVAMNLPYALAGFPMWIHSIPLAWGMFTGSGAHSGYSGAFANGDKHNAHHLYHNVNFGLLMIADAIFGTHWQPGDPQPRVWSEAVKIWNDFPAVHGSEDASAFLPAPGGPTNDLPAKEHAS